MKLRFFLVVLFLSSIISQSLGLLLASENIPSYGVISYSSTVWSKTVTWTGGPSETITISDEGHVIIDGVKVTPVGFCIGPPAWEPGITDEAANAMLNWCVNHGIRFMTLCLYSIRGTGAEGTKVNFWLPKFYAHKMFVMIRIAPLTVWPPFNRNQPLDVSALYNQFKSMIDLVAKQPYAASIFAVEYCAEWDIYGYTEEELKPFFDDFFPLCKSYVHQSLIGNVPVNAAFTITSPGCGQIAITTHSDVMCQDMYIEQSVWAVEGERMFYPGGSWGWYESEMKKIIKDSGREGHTIWFNEHGCRLSGGGDVGGMDYYTPEMLDWVLNRYFAAVSLLNFWMLYDPDSGGWRAFNNDGTPREWLIKLEPYLPKVS